MHNTAPAPAYGIMSAMGTVGRTDEASLQLAEAVGWLTTAQAAVILDRKRPTIRWWVHKGWLTGVRGHDGQVRYALNDLWDAERRARCGDPQPDMISANTQCQ